MFSESSDIGCQISSNNRSDDAASASSLSHLTNCELYAYKYKPVEIQISTLVGMVALNIEH